MKKIVFLMLTMCFVASLVFAAELPVVKSSTPAQAAAASETVVLKGTIIDNMCAGSKTGDDLAALVKSHTKQCALQCESSGYSIFSDGKLYKFGHESNAKVAEFLKKADSNTEVLITAEKSGDELSLISIENQK